MIELEVRSEYSNSNMTMQEASKMIMLDSADGFCTFSGRKVYCEDIVRKFCSLYNNLMLQA